MSDSPMDYDEFRADYLRRHPSSVPTKAKARHEYPLWIWGGVILMYASSAGLSGVHTAPTVYQAIDLTHVTKQVAEIVSVGSFGAVELAIPLSAFMTQEQQRLAKWVRRTAFTIAVIANIIGTSRAQTAADTGAILVSLALGFGMPLIALMSGEMLVKITASRRTINAAIDREFGEAMRQLDRVINGQWTQYDKSTRPSAIHPLSNGRMDALPPSAAVHPQTQNGYVGGQSGRASAGSGRGSEAFNNAYAFFEANPDVAYDKSITNESLEARIPGAKKSTIHKARTAFKQTHSNGASAEDQS